jgi:5-methyltetrahydropteroyltriglutamate--homocysteine methyltransferase
MSATPGLHLSSTGSYPRTGDSPELQALSRTIAGLDRGERSQADLLDVQNEVTRHVIGEQVKAGLDVVTDGLIRWYDPISHLAGKLDNIEIKGLVRFFDTDTYFRQPVFVGAPVKRGHLVAGDYSFARNALGHLPTPQGKAGKLSVKPVLSGPYTLGKFSLGEKSGNGSAGTFTDLEKRVQAYAEILASELEPLSQAGAELVQIDEPAAIKHPNDWKLFEASLTPLVQARDKILKNGRKLELALYVYFHDCAPLYEKLFTLPVDVVGLDFTYSPQLVDVVASTGSPKPLGLGLIDGRNTSLEDPAQIARQVERMLPKIKGERAFLGPSCGLEYLPCDQAFAKLELLSKVRAELQGRERQ